MSDHAGTHVDAFKHFGPGGAAIDEMPLEDFYTSAIALDLSHVELGASISVAEMEEALEASGEEIREGDTVLVHMGFNQRVHFDEERWQHCFPGLHPEAVEWLAGRGCGMFGEILFLFFAFPFLSLPYLLGVFPFLSFPFSFGLDSIMVFTQLTRKSTRRRRSDQPQPRGRDEFPGAQHLRRAWDDAYGRAGQSGQGGREGKVYFCWVPVEVEGREWESDSRGCVV
jgi:hypothetical protein